MKSMKGKLLKKLKTIKSIGYIKPERFLHVNASDGYFEASLPQTQKDTNFLKERSLIAQEPEIIDVTELMRDLKNDEIEFDYGFDEKENIRPKTGDKNTGFPVTNWDPEERKLEAIKSRFWGERIGIKTMKSNQDLGGREIKFNDEFDEKENIRPETGDENRRLSVSISDLKRWETEAVECRISRERIDLLSEFRRPDLDSSSLFDPNLLAAFEKAVIEFKAQEAKQRARIKEKEKEKEKYQIYISDENDEPPLKSQKIDEKRDPKLDFDVKCPPGGGNSVILYTTSLRSIRKTFEDCHSVRFLLESFRVLYIERDISMHSEFREELWRVTGEKLVPPCLFIKGRYIGGADRILGLHERGELRALFEGVPIDSAVGPCDGCGGARFMVCFSCDGSRKAAVFYDMAVGPDDKMEVGSDVAVGGFCSECNENGLIICPICC